MGKLHPHGGAYGAMVTASQWWTNGAPLVDGWGNWGSPTDGPAAARYTEAKLTEYAFSTLLQDSDTWQLKDNYDGSLKEPIQLNARVPNILVNGGEGIGVGFATKVPTHNLLGIAEALNTGHPKHLTPDFPTGCDIIKDQGLLDYLKEGRGSIRCRARCERTEVEHGKRARRPACVFTNLPMHVDTESVGQQIKSAVEAGKITTVADVRDETGKDGIRLLVIGKASTTAEAMEAEIFRYTNLDTKFSANNLVIDGTKPVQLSPMDILQRWGLWRDGRLKIAIKHELDIKRKRADVLRGLLYAADMMEEVVDLIRRCKDRSDAKKKLMAQYEWPEHVADAILDMKLHQLTRLDEEKLRTELKVVSTRIKKLIRLNTSAAARKKYIIDEVTELAHDHGTKRNSKLIGEPEETIVVAKQTVAKASGPKPRFLSVDKKKGIITQERKLPRGGMVLEHSDKLVILSSDGVVRKVAATFKGPLGKFAGGGSRYKQVEPHESTRHPGSLQAR